MEILSHVQIRSCAKIVEDNLLDMEWDGFLQAQKSLQIAIWRIRSLSISDQLSILGKAIADGNKAEAIFFVSYVEPIGYSVSDRSLTKGLLKELIEIAVFPGSLDLDAQVMVFELVKNFPECGNQVTNLAIVHLESADKNSDYEVFMRVGKLLYKTGSHYFNTFLERCKNHSSSEVNELVELF